MNTRVLELVDDKLGGQTGKETLTFPTPGNLAKYVDVRTVQTPALDLIDAALLDAVNGISPRLIISCPPQEGKTSRVSRTFPAWLLQRNPDLRIAVVSYAQDLALTVAKLVRNDIESNPDLGITVRRDTRAGGEWRLQGHDGGMIAAGIGSGLAGRPVDVLLVDDPLKDRQEADSEKYRTRCWDWWTEVGSARLGPGSIVIVVMCIVAGMRVLRGDGKWIPVEDIVPGDTVVSLSEDGVTLRTAEVTATRKSGHDDVVTVETDRLRLSTNERHPYAVLRRDRRRPAASQVEWVRAGDIEPDDVVVTARSLPDDFEPDDTLPDGSTVDEERAWLLGYMLGDGWVTRHTRRNQQGQPTSYAVCIAVGSSHKAIKADLPQRVRKAFEAWSPNRVYETSHGYLRTDWNAGGRLLHDLGYGAGAKAKRIPEAVWRWSPNLRRAFLYGYAAADGALTRAAGGRVSGDVWTITSVNLDLLSDTRYLALTCGIRPSRVYEAKPRIYHPPNSREPIVSVCHSIRLSFIPDDLGEGRSMLADYEHPSPRHIRYERVRSVTRGGTADVYDITVAGTENFVAEGFVVHNTRWHQDDLVGRLIEDAPDKWRIINIPAQADHQPETGETDILGRQPGEFMESARGRTLAEWEDRKQTAGSRTWNALYQGRPSPAGGGIFQRAWWKYYDTPRAVADENGAMRVLGKPTVEIHVDATFKDTKSSDFVVMQVWAQSGPKAWLLDQVRARMDFTATCDALVALSAKWPQAHAKVIEDKANGPAIISALRRDVSGIVGFTPKDSKLARASAIAPFVEAGDVEIPSPRLAPWVSDYVEEFSAFPNGAHDDQVDGTSQALHRLLLKSRPSVRFV